MPTEYNTTHLQILKSLGVPEGFYTDYVESVDTPDEYEQAAKELRYGIIHQLTVMSKEDRVETFLDIPSEYFGDSVQWDMNESGESSDLNAKFKRDLLQAFIMFMNRQYGAYWEYLDFDETKLLMHEKLHTRIMLRLFMDQDLMKDIQSAFYISDSVMRDYVIRPKDPDKEHDRVKNMRAQIKKQFDYMDPEDRICAVLAIPAKFFDYHLQRDAIEKSEKPSVSSELAYDAAISVIEHLEQTRCANVDRDDFNEKMMDRQGVVKYLADFI